MIKQETKICVVCKNIYKKTYKESKKQWQQRKCCSRLCASKIPRIDTQIRFWKKVDKKEINECWNWRGAKTRGYGEMSLPGRGRPIYASHVSWMIYFGEIPDKKIIRHKCDNPACVNPHHLELGTPRDNTQDMVKRGRLNPKSLLNLHPGEKGCHGAGRKSIGEVYAK